MGRPAGHRGGAPPLTILDAMNDRALFGKAFAGPSWHAWRAFLASLFGLPMSEDQAAVFRRCTGRQAAPETPAREAWVIAGRRGGKSRIAALVAVFLAAFRDWRTVLAPGERGVVMVLAADRQQARVVFRYIEALVDGTPLLAPLVAARTADSLELTTGAAIEVHTSSFRAVRGYTVIAAVADEIGFWWNSEAAANPDTEILDAIRPGTATVPSALLLCISTPHARRGALAEAHRRHYGRDGDPILVWQADTRTMNPHVPEALIAEAYARDAAVAASEYGAVFRTDLEDFVTREVLEGVITPGQPERPPVLRHRYGAFVDPAGGAGQDSMTLAIAHVEDDQSVALDLVREARPPFSPEATVADFAALLTRYGVRTVVGDKFGGDWPAERFRTHRIAYVAAPQTKSQLYGELLPLLTSQAVALVDDRRLVGQLLALERRTAWGGRDTIDHPPGGHDDLANAAAGALVLAAATRRDRRGPRLALGGLAVVRVQAGAAEAPAPAALQRPWRWPPELWLPRDRPSEGP